MIKSVHASLLKSFTRNKRKPLMIATCLAASATVLATVIIPQGLRIATAANNDIEVVNVEPEIGTISRLWTDQNNIKATIKNNGTQDQSDITVDLTVTGANAEHQVQTIPFLAAGASTTVTFMGSVANTGTQTIEVKVPDDEDNANNTLSISQEVTCNNFAYTGTESIYDGFGLAAPGIITARYNAPGVPVQLTGVSFHLANNPDNIGKTVTPMLLDEAGNIIDDGPDFVATASDLNTTIQLPFYYPAIINPGEAFYIGIRQAEGGHNPVGLSSPTATPANRYYTFPDGGGTGTEYTGPGNLKIGAVGEMAAELNISVYGQIMEGRQVTFTATSGYELYTFKVNGNVVQSSANNEFTYYPAPYDQVHVVISRNGCSTSPIGNYSMDVLGINPTNNILYVNKNSIVPGDGSSWDAPLIELADALRYAKARQINWTAATPLQIWVAGGTYKPLYSPADNNFGNDDGMNNAFLLVKNTRLYGGFAGNENTLEQRDLSLTANKSILSGDYYDDDQITGSGGSLTIDNRFENACHVVIASGDVETASMDGFTIKGGGGDAESLNDIDVNGNTITKLAGAGLHNYLASPVYTNLIVTGNTSSFFGGGIYNDQSSAVYTNVLITDNLAEFQGGGMANANLSSPILTNLTISNNNAAVSGGGIANMSSSPSIRNTIVYGNSDGMSNMNSMPFAVFSLIEGLPEDPANHNLDGALDAMFLNPASGNYTLKAESPGINAGNRNYYEEGETPDLSWLLTDIAGKPRITGSTIDLGVYESSSKDQNITASDINLTYGDADYELTATASSGLPVSYTLASDSTAEIYQDPGDGKWKIKIKEAGAVTITVSQPGDLVYDPAPDVEILLIVNRKELVATAENKTKAYGEALPALTISYSGFVGTDGIHSIIAPEIITTATATSAPGEYPIILKHGDADNYSFKLINGTLIVEGAIITIQQQPVAQTICAGSTVNFTTNATASMSATITYQWQQSSDNNDWNNIAGATKAELNTTAVNDLYYRCVLKAPGREVNTDAVKLVVKPVDKPIINVPNTICLSEARFALSASLQGGVFSGQGVGGNTWYIDSLKPGGHMIQYTYNNANGCTVVTSKSVSLSLCGEKDQVIATKAQPNPTTGHVTVKALLAESTRQNITVTNAFGQKVLQQQLKLTKGWNLIPLDLTSVGSGIYFITITGFDKTPATVIRILKM
ncbi:MAG: T9SS type A sorting domain-containing protein [Niastella sp.]|nr:T9SS type A sorting domain-containing protein [Niastella sp.]